MDKPRQEVERKRQRTVRREEEDKDAEDAEGAFGDEEAESLLPSIEEQHREQALFDAEQAASQVFLRQ